jgi:hypothetical protein
VTLRFRKRARLGPFRLNFTRRGLSSISIKLGPLTHNLTHRRTTVDLPGGLYWQESHPYDRQERSS